MTAHSTTTSTESEDAPLTDPEVRERLRELPPSAKLVARVLTEDGPLAPGVIADRSLLPQRTMRYALTRLEEADLLATSPHPRDAHTTVYDLQR